PSAALCERRSPRYSIIRVPLLIAATANTPLPCTGELRTSMSGEVAMGGPPRVGWDWSNSVFFVLLIRPVSNSHRRLDCRVMLVIHDLKVFEVVVENRRRPAREIQLRQCERHARQLLVHLLQVIHIEMTVATRPDELARFEIALLRHHVREQGVRGDVKRHAQEYVGAALVELAAQPLVRHVELEERMAGHELHLVELAHVPG